MDKGILYGVSVGPGDPELLTVKAVRAIQAADVVAVPKSAHGRQTALEIAREYVAGKSLLDCETPMMRDRTAVLQAYDAIADTLCALLDEGKTIAYLCLGDIGVYSTYGYLHDLVRSRGYECRIIPGVTSFCAASAALGMPLCEGPENLVVAPVLAGDVREALDVSGTKVFMKSGRALSELRDTLESRGKLDRASLVVNCGMPGEQVFPRFAEADLNEVEGYFSLVIVKDALAASAESEG